MLTVISGALEGAVGTSGRRRRRRKGSLYMSHIRVYIYIQHYSRVRVGYDAAPLEPKGLTALLRGPTRAAGQFWVMNLQPSDQ